MMNLRQMLPAVHRHLLPSFFDETVPEETQATCDRCVMSLPDVLPERTPEGFFRPDVKCCSFHPNLPNFLVGAVLDDTSPEMAEGRERIRARIAARISVGPVWLAAPRKYTLLFLASRKTSFGRSLILRCPYFDPQNANCSIWRHRDAVCTTFFCKHVGGSEGSAMWRAIEMVLRGVERRLAEYAARTLGAEIPNHSNSLDTLTLEELEERAPDSATYTSTWGIWLNREEEYYRTCRDVVSRLDAPTFEQMFADDEMVKSLDNARFMLDQMRHAAGTQPPTNIF